MLQVFSSGLEKTVRGLVTGQPYSFCVTAFTMVGEGGCSPVVVETPRLPQGACRLRRHSLGHGPIGAMFGQA